MVEKEDQVDAIKHKIWEETGNSSPTMSQIILQIPEGEVVETLLDYSARCIDPLEYYLDQRNTSVFRDLQIEKVERWIEHLDDEAVYLKLYEELKQWKDQTKAV